MAAAGTVRQTVVAAPVVYGQIADTSSSGYIANSSSWHS